MFPSFLLTHQTWAYITIKTEGKGEFSLYRILGIGMKGSTVLSQGSSMNSASLQTEQVTSLHLSNLQLPFLLHGTCQLSAQGRAQGFSQRLLRFSAPATLVSACSAFCSTHSRPASLQVRFSFRSLRSFSFLCPCLGASCCKRASSSKVLLTPLLWCGRKDFKCLPSFTAAQHNSFPT